jgi:cation diffusion facilitator CzcD-associated flavoprotein CzcO
MSRGFVVDRFGSRGAARGQFMRRHYHRRSPAGLATEAALKARGLNAAVLEKSTAIVRAWRRHYDRLHLHTDRARSGLPGLAIPKAYGRYPSRARVVEYLETYAAKFALRPVFNAAVRAVRRDGRGWRAEAGENSQTAPVVVVATGLADYPHAPTWPGMETFDGAILRSSSYRNPAPFTGKRVLVVGLGASGGEIALDFSEAGVDVALAVRGPINVIPRSCSKCRSSPGSSPADCFPRE